jgi:RimJ/RimL family protein N-acetyltransferase
MIEDLRTTVSYLASIRPLGYHWLMKLVLYTDRLTLIPLHMSDVDIAVELFTDPEVLRFTGGVLEEEEVHRELPKWIRRGGNGCIGVWCITSSDSGEKLGTGALLPMPVEEDDTDWDLLVPGYMPNNDIEVGYFLKESAWGKGYATEACCRLLKLAFEEMPLSEVVASYDAGNDASRKVLLKCGFVEYGIRRCYGEDGPDLRASREEWLVAKNP